MNLKCVNAYNRARVEWWKRRKNKGSEQFHFLQAGLDPGKRSGEKQSRDELQKAGKWKLRKISRKLKIKIDENKKWR